MIALRTLAKGFNELEHYQSTSGYRLLPMRFCVYDADRYLVTNLVGEYVLVPKGKMKSVVEGKLPPSEPLYNDLKAKHLIVDSVSDVGQELLAAKYRTKLSGLAEFTGLHIFVVTLRCDHSCPYCQVSRVSEDRGAFDMTEATASKAIDLMFRSPSRYLKVEFQGGESLLNFELIKFITLESKRRNEGRDLEFVIATNLSAITDEQLAFCREHSILISTSLDGPEGLHNVNRPRPDRDSHQRVTANIERVRLALGRDRVSALMTTTARALEMPTAIIDEYARLGFHSIFLRSISPYGFALRSAVKIGYSTDAFLEFYRQGLDYIIDLNKQGIPMREEYATIILRKIFTPYANGYVDLQSPSGIGLSVLVYNYDGAVYGSDEGRMLAETGDFTFRLGDVHRNSYEQIIGESQLLPIVYESMAEGIPQCTDCAFLPWCGTDPVFHHATQGDFVGRRPTSAYCQRNMGVFRILIDKMESDAGAAAIMRRWVS